jgi:hypothetical protein
VEYVHKEAQQSSTKRETCLLRGPPKSQAEGLRHK